MSGDRQMFQTGLMKFKKFVDDKGCLSAIEGGVDIPFNIQRIYYITNVKNGAERGFHSHKKLHQVLICLNGDVKIRVYNGDKYEMIHLTKPDEGLYLGPMVWREMCEFSEQCVLMVLASEHYDENDYVRDFNLYLNEARKYFQE